MVGSPRTVKYTARCSGVALVNMNWCASVVLPLPGSPTMMLNEYSGQPPPRMSSSFDTPVGSRSMRTFFCGSVMFTFDLRGPDRCGFPRSLDERHDQIFADECAEQSNFVGQDSGEACVDRLELDLCANALEPLKRASLAILRNDIR